ncbi:hypothetical protein BsWGS_06435 [Bradybaena similaris]
MAEQHCYREIAEPHRSNISQESKPQDAALSAKSKVREELKFAMETDQQEFRQERKALMKQIDALRLETTRLEEEHSRREDRLRQEIAHLLERLQQDKVKSPDLTHSETSATQPFLRQIENLQTTLGAQSVAWERVEKNLTERLAQISLAIAQEKENAKDHLMELSARVASLEAADSRIKQDKAQLAAQVESDRYKLEELQDVRNSAAAQLEFSKQRLNQEPTQQKIDKARMEHPREGYQMPPYQLMQQISDLYSQGAFIGQQSNNPFTMGSYGNYGMPGINPSIMMGSRQDDLTRINGGNMVSPYYSPSMSPDAHAIPHAHTAPYAHAAPQAHAAPHHGALNSQPSSYSHSQANPHMQQQQPQAHMGMMPNQGHHSITNQSIHGQGGQHAHSTGHNMGQVSPHQSSGGYGSQRSLPMMLRKHHVLTHPMRYTSTQQKPQEVADNILPTASSYLPVLMSDLEHSQEKIRGLQTALDNSYKEIGELHRSNASQCIKAQEAALGAETHVREALKFFMEREEQRFRQEREALIKQIDDLRFQIDDLKFQMARLENEKSRREDLLKQEIAHLQEVKEIMKQTATEEKEMEQWGADSEYQALQDEKKEQVEELMKEGEKLSKQQLQSTILKKLQVKEKENETTIAAQKKKLDKQTKELERLITVLGLKQEMKNVQSAQIALAMAQEKERTANDHLMELSARVASLEAANKQEKAQLAAEVKSDRPKLEELQDISNSAAAQLESSKQMLNVELTQLKMDEDLEIPAHSS